MKLTVKYLMTFSQLAGCKSEQIELPSGSTVQHLTEKLILRHGRKFKKALEKDIDHRSVIILVNGRSGKMDTILHDSDEILISYPVGGG